MITTASVGGDPVFVEVRVCNKIMIAAELAANAVSKPVSDFLEDILIDHLAKSGYLRDSVDINQYLSSNK